MFYIFSSASQCYNTTLALFSRGGMGESVTIIGLVPELIQIEWSPQEVTSFWSILVSWIDFLVGSNGLIRIDTILI